MKVAVNLLNLLFICFTCLLECTKQIELTLPYISIKIMRWGLTKVLVRTIQLQDTGSYDNTPYKVKLING